MYWAGDGYECVLSYSNTPEEFSMILTDDDDKNVDDDDDDDNATAVVRSTSKAMRRSCRRIAFRITNTSSIHITSTFSLLILCCVRLSCLTLFYYS